MDDMLIKLAVTVAVVLLLTEISRRSSPTVAGILAGLPLGVGITVFFLAREQGTGFVAEAIPWGIAGLSATVLFCLAYLLVGLALRNRGRILQITACTVAAVAAYILFSASIRGFAMDLGPSLAITGTVMVGNLLLLSRLPIAHRTAAGRKRSSVLQVLVRGATAGLFVVLITGLARRLGAEWSGIFTAFPSMLFPLLLILHIEEGDRLYPGIILGYGFSVSNLVLFYLVAFFLLPRTSLGVGFGLLYAVSALYLFILNRLKNRVLHRSAVGERRRSG